MRLLSVPCPYPQTYSSQISLRFFLSFYTLTTTTTTTSVALCCCSLASSIRLIGNCCASSRHHRCTFVNLGGGLLCLPRPTPHIVMHSTTDPPRGDESPDRRSSSSSQAMLGFMPTTADAHSSSNATHSLSSLVTPQLRSSLPGETVLSGISKQQFSDSPRYSPRKLSRDYESSGSSHNPEHERLSISIQTACTTTTHSTPASDLNADAPSPPPASKPSNRYSGGSDGEGEGEGAD